MNSDFPGRYDQRTLGQRAAEAVAHHVGSWKFVLSQTLFLMLWVSLNTSRYAPHWDPYPFILMNLVLSLQAAYTAPMILMSQNRQAEVDRKVLHGDFAIDKATHLAMTEMLDRIKENENKLNELVRLLSKERDSIESRSDSPI